MWLKCIHGGVCYGSGKESVPLQLFELTAKVGFNEGFLYIAANKGV
ncbi:hypothetical protein G3P61_004295 [Vibrio parahaemolyticus]|nr:hypothetical protein [Vibrio parahaemolyticus]